MKISDLFLLEAIEEKLESAVRYGVTRAYKHSDLQPPSDAQVEIICESVRSTLFEIIVLEQVD
jgi:hypothetical protein